MEGAERESGADDMGEDGKPEQQHQHQHQHQQMTLVCPMLPCWDETDDGVPPPCRGESAWWKVFNKNHPLTNDNLLMIMFGNVGYPYFDRHRKCYMAIAMWSTFVSIFFTIAGCLALSTDLAVVKKVRWAFVHGKNHDTGEVFVVYLGLRSLVYESEPCVPTHCTRKSYNFAETKDWPHENGWPIEYLDEGLEECRDFSLGLVFSVFVTCATLVFALIGTINRMKFSSDANVQKALGMVTDTIGFITLAENMFGYQASCSSAIDRKFTNSAGERITADVHLSIGWGFYAVCLFGAFMRCIFHWLTPLPGRGSHGIFVCALPEELVKKMDIDGDGKVSWEEMRIAFAAMKESEKAHMRKVMKNLARKTITSMNISSAHIVSAQPQGGGGEAAAPAPKTNATRGPESTSSVVPVIAGDADTGEP